VPRSGLLLERRVTQVKVNRTSGVVALAIIAVLVSVIAIAVGCGGTKGASVSPSSAASTTSVPGGPPAWVQDEARSVAAKSDSPKPASFEWMLTTMKRAARVVGMTEKTPSVKADPGRKVYIIIERGTFSSSQFGSMSAGSPPPAPWYVSATDANVKQLLRVGLLPARPDTSSLGKMHVFTF